MCQRTTVAQAENVRVGIVKGTNVGVHHGGHDYHDAFSGPNEERKDGPTAAATEELLAKSADQPLDQIRLSISYLDPERRLDTKDVARQIAWYRGRGMLKNEIAVGEITDSRFVTPLPLP